VFWTPSGGCNLVRDPFEFVSFMIPETWTGVPWVFFVEMRTQLKQTLVIFRPPPRSSV